MSREPVRGDSDFPGPERRRFARISNNYFLRSFRPGTAEEENRTVGIVRDINHAGLAFLTAAHYSVGEVVGLEIELLGLKNVDASQSGLLNSAAVEVQATVARIAVIEPGLNLVGVLFHPMDEEEAGLIQRAVVLEKQMDMHEKT